jgi:hypothetical protein
VGLGAVPGPIRTGEWNSYITCLSKGHIVPQKKKRTFKVMFLSGHPSMCSPDIMLLSLLCCGLKAGNGDMGKEEA